MFSMHLTRAIHCIGTVFPGCREALQGKPTHPKDVRGLRVGDPSNLRIQNLHAFWLDLTWLKKSLTDRC